MSTQSDPLEFRPIWELVLERLRAAILTGELSGGLKLIESEIADKFGVSRGPVREALRELAREGLVIDLPRRGTVVCTITQADLMEVYAVREALEVQAVRDSLEFATAPELAAVETAHQAMVEAYASKSWSDAVNADKDFHRAIVQLAKNSRLSSMYELMAHQTLLLLVTASKTDISLMTAPLDEIHKSMADAVVARDLGAATDAIRHHYQYTRLRILPALDLTTD